MSSATVCNCQHNPKVFGQRVPDSRASNRKQKTPDGRTCWAGGVVRTVGDCRPKADAGGKRRQKLVNSGRERSPAGRLMTVLGCSVFYVCDDGVGSVVEMLSRIYVATNCCCKRSRMSLSCICPLTLWSNSTAKWTVVQLNIHTMPV